MDKETGRKSGREKLSRFEYAGRGGVLVRPIHAIWSSAPRGEEGGGVFYDLKSKPKAKRAVGEGLRWGGVDGTEGGNSKVTSMQRRLTRCRKPVWEDRTKGKIWDRCLKKKNQLLANTRKKLFANRKY